MLTLVLCIAVVHPRLHEPIIKSFHLYQPTEDQHKADSNTTGTEAAITVEIPMVEGGEADKERQSGSLLTLSTTSRAGKENEQLEGATYFCRTML